MSKLEGVKKVSVDVRNKKATVTLDGKTSLSKEAVAKALGGTRYKVTSFESQKDAKK